MLVAVAALLAYGLAPRRQAPRAERPLDRDAAWQRLGLTQSRQEFEQALQGLPFVVLDRPPVVGTDYNPTFPPDVPFAPDGPPSPSEIGGSRWKTNQPSPSIANPDAPHGGTLRLMMDAYPPTLRTDGPNTRLTTLRDMQVLVYESMLNYDVTLGDYVPWLADYWQILPDRQTFRFHLNPKAKWADGRPLTADDVVATFEHLRRADRKDPEMAKQWNEHIASVKMIDAHIVEFRSKKPYWRTFYMIASQNIFPAAYIRMPGDVYLTDWNWKLPPGTGPYELRPDGLVKGISVTMRRRHNYWNEDDPAFKGTFNFDAVKWEKVLDEELGYQKFLAGEFDAYRVMRAQRWVDELPREKAVQMGWLQMRKIWELAPQGFGGFAFNMRQKPFDDRNVREAFAHLFNRDLLFAKFFFYQYEYEDSYFPSSIYSRPDARPVQYDPAAARELLAKSGWTQRSEDGHLMNEDGRKFPDLLLTDPNPSFFRIFEVVKNDLWEQAGIKMTIQQLDSPSQLKRVWDNQFQLVHWNWSGDDFPDYDPMFGSKYASMPQSNNIVGFKNAKADALMEKYKLEFDQAERVRLMQQLDQILFDEHPYALNWSAPYYRIVWWDKFGYPPEYGQRYIDDMKNLVKFWWYDPQRAAATENNKARGVPNYPDRPDHQAEPVDQKYWLDHELPARGEKAGWKKPAAGTAPSPSPSGAVK